MIVTIDEFKTYAGIDNDDDDEVIELILVGAIGWCESICSNRFEQKDCEEMFDGDSDELFLDNTLNIKEIIVEQYINYEWVVLDTSMFTVYADQGLVKLRNVAYGELNYRVKYKAGFADDAPHDLKLIILKITGKFWNKRKSDGVRNENLGDAGVTWEEYLNTEVVKVLNRYRKYNI